MHWKNIETPGLPVAPFSGCSSSRMSNEGQQEETTSTKAWNTQAQLRCFVNISAFWFIQFGYALSVYYYPAKKSSMVKSAKAALMHLARNSVDNGFRPSFSQQLPASKPLFIFGVCNLSKFHDKRKPDV